MTTAWVMIFWIYGGSLEPVTVTSGKLYFLSEKACEEKGDEFKQKLKQKLADGNYLCVETEVKESK
jgi:hypothetical protein